MADRTFSGVMPTQWPEVASWLSALARPGHEGILAPEFLKPFHFVTLGLALRRSRGRVVLPRMVEDYAIRMGLWEAAKLTPPRHVPKRDPYGRFLPVAALSDPHETERVIQALAGILDAHPAGAASRHGLARVLEELVENCYHHSARSEGGLWGLACAQAWPGGGLAQVAIADAGIGIRASLDRNPALASRLAIGNSCALAIELYVTGDAAGSHSGYGLTLASDLAARNGGTLIVASGHEAVVRTACGAQPITSAARWDGTLVVFEWRLADTLDVRAVYDMWPPLEDDV